MVACDLGSNTFRVVEIDCNTKDRVREFEKIVKSAEGLAQSGKISEDAQKRIISAINEAKKIFTLDGAKAVTTAALREAKNAKEVVNRIYKETGLSFEIIDAKQEAEYVRVAVSSYIDSDNYMIMDLGGGSTEFIFKEFDKSFSIGIVTLTDRYSDIGLGIKKEFKAMRDFAKDIKRADIFVATAGTPTTIAAFLKGIDYKNYDYKKINNTILTIEDLYNSLDKLLNMDFDERVRWVGVGRDDLIIAGVKMFIEILKIFDFDKAVVIDDGVREGVAKVECKKLKNS